MTARTFPRTALDPRGHRITLSPLTTTAQLDSHGEHPGCVCHDGCSGEYGGAGCNASTARSLPSFCCHDGADCSEPACGAA